MENTKEQLTHILASAWIDFNSGKFTLAKDNFKLAAKEVELRQEALEGFYLCCMNLDKFEEAKILLALYGKELNEKNRSFLAYAIEQTKEAESTTFDDPAAAFRNGLVKSQNVAQDLFTNPDIDLDTTIEAFKVMKANSWLDLFNLIDFFQEHGHKNDWRGFFIEEYFLYWEELHSEGRVSTFDCKNIALQMFNFEFFDQSFDWYKKIERKEDVDRINGLAKLAELGFGSAEDILKANVAKAWEHFKNEEFDEAQKLFETATGREDLKDEVENGLELIQKKKNPDKLRENLDFAWAELEKENFETANKLFESALIREDLREEAQKGFDLTSKDKIRENLDQAWREYNSSNFELAADLFNSTLGREDLRNEGLEGLNLVNEKRDLKRETLDTFLNYSETLSNKNKMRLFHLVRELEAHGTVANYVNVFSEIVLSNQEYLDECLKWPTLNYKSAEILINSEKIHFVKFDTIEELFFQHYEEPSWKSLILNSVIPLLMDKISYEELRADQISNFAWRIHDIEVFDKALDVFQLLPKNDIERIRGLAVCASFGEYTKSTLDEVVNGLEHLHKAMFYMSVEILVKENALNSLNLPQIKSKEYQMIATPLIAFEMIKSSMHKDAQSLIEKINLEELFQKEIQFKNLEVKEVYDFCGPGKLLKSLFFLFNLIKKDELVNYLCEIGRINELLEITEKDLSENKEFIPVFTGALKNHLPTGDAYNILVNSDFVKRNPDDPFIQLEIAHILYKGDFQAVDAFDYNLEKGIIHSSEYHPWFLYHKWFSDGIETKNYENLTKILPRMKRVLEIEPKPRNLEQDIESIISRATHLMKIRSDLSQLDHKEILDFVLADIYFNMGEIAEAKDTISDYTKTEFKYLQQLIQDRESDNVPVEVDLGKGTYDFSVMWSLHNKCNYHCSYCPPILNNGDITWMKLENLKTFIDKINGHYVEKLGKENVIFSFTGGEPTLWKDFKPFVRHIDSYGFRVGLTTNASIASNFWNDIGSAFDYICMSYHPENADTEKFLANFKAFHDNPEFVIPSVRIMMHPEEELWNKSMDLYNRIREFDNWTIQCVHILDDYGNNPVKIKYSTPEKERFLKDNSFVSQFNNGSLIPKRSLDFNYVIKDKSGKVETLNENHLISNDLAKFYGWDCMVGVDHLFIHHSGDIQLAGCGVGGVVSNVMDFRPEVLPTGSTKCTNFDCLCPTDIRIRKALD